MAKMTITGDKIVIEQSVLLGTCEKHAREMKSNAIRRAPKDTGKLKAQGIRKESMDNGAKVILDTDAVDYAFYQEQGWEQNGYHPGKHFMKSSFELEWAKSFFEAQGTMADAITVRISDGYDIVEYNKVGDKVKKGAYKK